jgi:hypothetical protein
LKKKKNLFSRKLDFYSYKKKYMKITSGAISEVGREAFSQANQGFLNYRGGVGKSTVSFSQSDSQSGLQSALNASDYQFGIRKVSSDSDGDVVRTRTKAVAEKQKIIAVAHDKFIELAKSENFEYGYTPSSERYLAEFATRYPALTGELAQEIALNGVADETIMIALLNAIGALDYEFLRPFGQILAVAAVTNVSVLVKEAAIRAYEAWGHPEGARILKAVDCPWPWLDKYRLQVIVDIGGQ